MCIRDSLKGGQLENRHFAWSPNGNHLAFIEQAQDSISISVYALESGARRLIADLSVHQPTHLTWVETTTLMFLDQKDQQVYQVDTVTNKVEVVSNQDLLISDYLFLARDGAFLWAVNQSSAPDRDNEKGIWLQNQDNLKQLVVSTEGKIILNDWNAEASGFYYTVSHENQRQICFYSLSSSRSDLLQKDRYLYFLGE